MTVKIDNLLNLLEHIELDPDFFTDNKELKSNIRDTLLELSNEVLLSLKDDLDLNITPTAIILTGSLCGFNWDEYSDIDFHLLVDFDTITLSKRSIVKRLLSLKAYKWNQNKYTLHNRSLELYFQDSDEKHEAPGIYDITHNHWIKEPVGSNIKTNGNITNAADKYKIEIQTMIDEYEASIDKTKQFITDTTETVKAYWAAIREMRKISLKNDGLGGMGNQIFKKLRRNDSLQMLVNFMRQLKNDYINAEV